MEGEKEARIVRYLNSSPLAVEVKYKCIFLRNSQKNISIPGWHQLALFIQRGRLLGGGMAIKAGVRPCLDVNINVNMMCKWA